MRPFFPLTIALQLRIKRPFDNSVLTFYLVWYAAQEELDQKRAIIEAQRAKSKEEDRIQREEMRKEMLGEEKK